VIVPLSSWIDGALKIPVFTLLEDGELTEKGASGIHSRFIFGPAEGEPQTLDQSVLLSPDRKTLYVLVARCSKLVLSRIKRCSIRLWLLSGFRVSVSKRKERVNDEY